MKYKVGDTVRDFRWGDFPVGTVVQATDTHTITENAMVDEYGNNSFYDKNYTWATAFKILYLPPSVPTSKGFDNEGHPSDVIPMKEFSRLPIGTVGIREDITTQQTFVSLGDGSYRWFHPEDAPYGLGNKICSYKNFPYYAKIRVIDIHKLGANNE